MHARTHESAHCTFFCRAQNVRCRLGGANGPSGVSGIGATWLDNATVQCNAMADAPAVTDPAVGAVLAVEVSIDGGATWTRATPEASYTVPCTTPPPSPPLPPLPPLPPPSPPPPSPSPPPPSRPPPPPPPPYPPNLGDPDGYTCRDDLFCTNNIRGWKQMDDLVRICNADPVCRTGLEPQPSRLEIDLPLTRASPALDRLARDTT